MFSLEKRRLKETQTVFKYVKGCYKEDGDKLFSVSTEGTTKSNGLDLQKGKLRFNIRKI